MKVRLLRLSLLLASFPMLGFTAVAEEASDSTGNASPPAIEQSLPHTYGIVARRSQWYVDLQDGRRVDLTKATVILPTGATISPGDRIGVFGLYYRPMVLRAASITVVSRGSGGIETVK